MTKGMAEDPITADDVQAMYEMEKARRGGMAAALRWLADEMEQGSGILFFESEYREEPPPFPISMLTQFADGSSMGEITITIACMRRIMSRVQVLSVGGVVSDEHH